MEDQNFNRPGPAPGSVQADEERNRKALRAARELAHCATSLASEAANLARALEAHHSAELTITASKASLDAARASFAIDDMATGGRSADLRDILERAHASLEAAEAAVGAARRAIVEARRAAGSAGGATGALG